MTSPAATIVITSFNKAPLIEEAVRSALVQGDDCEVIVVDDGSTDGSRELLTRLEREVGFRFIALEENRGVSTARNAGIEAARGMYLNFLDGDDYLLPGKIKTQLMEFEREPGLAVCYSDAAILKGGQMLPFTLKDLWPPHSGDILLRLLQGNCIALHAALLRTDFARNLRFDESLRRAEDWDFWLRAAQESPAFHFLDQPLVVYRRDGQSLSRDLIPALNDGQRVLTKVDEGHLTEAQRVALSSYRRGILEAKADAFLRRGDRTALGCLDEAEKITPLSGYRRLTARLLHRNFALGRAFYLAVSSAAQFKNRLKNPSQRRLQQF